MLGSIDLCSDVLENGVLKNTDLEYGLFPFFYHHDPIRQTGWYVEGYEDELELFVPGLLDVNVTSACESTSFLENGAKHYANY